MRSPCTRGPLLRSDEGSVLVLGLGAVVVCLLALVVGVDASSAFLQRRSLVALADACAIAGAQGIDLGTYYREGASASTGLDPRAVAQRVTSFLAAAQSPRDGRADSSGVEGLRLERVWMDDRTVVVRLSAPLRLPFLSALGDRAVTVESRARLAYRAAG